MNICFIPFKNADLLKAYELYKTELRSIIDSAFGWNDDYQHQRFMEKYPLNWFFWISIEDNVHGFICFNKKQTELHVSLLIIDRQYQGSGIGSMVMETICGMSPKITLSCFKNNQRAITFYEKLGFKLVNKDNYFFDFELTKETLE